MPATPSFSSTPSGSRSATRGFVRNKAVYIALAILPDGTKEILEGAKFWLRVMNELKNRGVQDILLAVVDGLKGFPEAINATFPETVVQTCIVHLIRHSMNFASWKDRKHVAKALRDVYRAKDADAGLAALDAFEAGPWGEKYPAIAQSWRRNWEHVSPFFVFPEAVRRIVYTTNAIESLNAKIRRAVRTRGHFPSDEAASKLLYLVLDHAAEAWKRPPREWFEAKTQFAVIFGERVSESTVTARSLLRADRRRRRAAHGPPRDRVQEVKRGSVSCPLRSPAGTRHSHARSRDRRRRTRRRTRECRGRLPIARDAVAKGRSAGGNPRPLALVERRGMFDVSGLLV